MTANLEQTFAAALLVTTLEAIVQYVPDELERKSVRLAIELARKQFLSEEPRQTATILAFDSDYEEIEEVVGREMAQ